MAIFEMNTHRTRLTNGKRPGVFFNAFPRNEYFARLAASFSLFTAQFCIDNQ
jgi:hypothetical protein